MTRYLTAHLAAPLASFGGIAVGERRSGGDRPTKSAILGLVAGALGLEREDPRHTDLARDFFYAVRTENMKVRTPRRLMTDFHTAQTPPRGRNQRFATRREELADKQNLGTILSYREYRGDCSFTFALWPRGTAPCFGLEVLADALRRPIFVPYAGRKSCPLMLPMQPLIREAATFREAFAQRDAEIAPEQQEFLRSYNLLAEPYSLAFDADIPGAKGDRRERHRDQILDRGRWQFGLREEAVAPWAERGQA